MTAMNDEALRREQRSRGATWRKDATGPPDDFGDVAAEYRAAIETCAIIDLSDRGHLELTGRDRASFLHNFCTQDIKRLPAGQGAEAFITTIKGRIAGHVLVFAGEEALWIDSVPGSVPAHIAHLDRYLITEDVQLADRSGEWGEFALVGPQAAHRVEALVPGSGTFGPLQHGHAQGITVRRFSFTRAAGWLVGAARDRLASLWRDLAQSGATPCGRSAFEALQIEAVFPTYGVDLTEDHLAQEAGRTREAISFTKGCYLGQEPIARIDALGHTNRELRGIELSDDSVPAVGAKVYDNGGKEVGTVSSAALSPIRRRGVALSTLRRDVCTPGTAVQVETGTGRRFAGVVFGRG
jgi:folate-binding protein YgfZ